MKITKPIFKVIIAGGRDFSNYELLQEKCDHLLRNKLLTHNVEIVSGCARGADALGIKYAEELKLNVLKFPADWEKFGKRAGYLRNEQMAEVADVLIAFWDGKSKGTKHMIDLADKYKLFVRIIHY